MSLYVIGDLHLSLGVEKPMDIFGGRWAGYMDKLRNSLSALSNDDVIVLCGDTSWGMSLQQALPDFKFLAAVPGKKIILKGNHDYWWTTAGKLDAYWAESGCGGLSLLHNNAYTYGSVALAGTKGWFYEEDGDELSGKIFKREMLRLTMSLDAAMRQGCEEIFCFLHYPPLYEGYCCDEIINIFSKYPVSKCFFGHLHGAARSRAIDGVYRNVEYTLISADNLDFKPLLIR